MIANTFMSIVLLSFLINFDLNYCEINDQNIVSVRLKNLVINGKIETSVDGKQLNVFKGIPYAEPPIGNLRFRKPIPVKEWPEIIHAYDWPNVCYQSKFEFLPNWTKIMSEDCLYLNIWTPSDSLNSTELKPVIFYIHGGALLYGSSSWKYDAGEVISAKGDIVIVNINYRYILLNKRFSLNL